MSDHDLLREAFATDERMAPDPAQVYARIEELGRTYKRRRRGAQVAGGAVLGAGLIAAAINLPGVLPASVSQEAPVTPAFAAAPAPAPSPTPSVDIRNLDAFFNAGYDLGDAIKLADIWKLPNDLTNVKAEAGRRLLAGETLPVKPSSKDNRSPKEVRQVEAFLHAGYDYADAVKLKKLWHTPDPYHAKVLGGKKLIAGETLPFKP
jgi:hypothetical protein